ncbi:MAG: LPS export ABC transporter periplasmic protein LptC [Gammaproteobacteria bacterium]|nr:LPS export ABC transporter periplasmic protein LptC [Gammaproteobacteria bacterium]
MNKFYYLLVLIVVLAIALISRWLLTTVETPTGRVAPEARHDPDYYLENFKITVYQPNGAPAYHLNAEHMNHYPDDDTMTMRKLQLDYSDEKNQTWVTTADAGTAYENIEVMQLNGNVRIVRQTPQPDQEITITTDALRFDVPNKFASTEARVKIVGKNSSIVAKGMEVDMVSGQLTLMSEARGHYVPD